MTEVKPKHAAPEKPIAAGSDASKARPQTQLFDKVAPQIIRHNTEYLNAALDALVELNLTKQKTELLKRLNELSEAHGSIDNKKNEPSKGIWGFFGGKSNRQDAHHFPQSSSAPDDKPKKQEIEQSPAEAINKVGDAKLQKQISKDSDLQPSAETKTKKPSAKLMELNNKVSKWNFNTSGTLNILIFLYGLSLVVIAFAIAYSLVFYR